MSATVIIPVTGAPVCRDAIESVLKQTYPTTCYVVCDGEQFRPQVEKILEEFKDNPLLKVCYLPINVGAKGFYGHRVYAAFTHLIDTDYVGWLDQDNWLYDTHVKQCVETIERRGLDWCYALRKIHDKVGKFICFDNCESLGKWPTFQGHNHIDTNCYFVKTEVAIKLASVWHGGWGQDRVFLQTITQYFQKWDCTNYYSVNYRVDGGKGSVSSQFFEHGNEVMHQRYEGKFPWMPREST